MCKQTLLGQMLLIFMTLFYSNCLHFQNVPISFKNIYGDAICSLAKEH
jgi:hypothetical protein